MSASFTYTLFTLGILFVIGLALFTYYRNKSIKRVQINPVMAILASIFFMALWLFDLTSLQIGEKGWLTTNGVIPGDLSQVPSWFVWASTLSAMIIILGVYYVYNNKFNTHHTKEFHKWLIITQMLGVFFFFVTALVMGLKGLDYVAAGFAIEGIYHSALPLIIIPNLILLIDTK